MDPKPHTPPYTVSAALIEVAATAHIHGGTRVITLTVTSVDGWHVVRLAACDSNHPGAELTVFVAGDTDREALVARAREFASAALRPSTPDEACDCWPGWNPFCGEPGCWGDDRHPLAAMASAGPAVA